MTKIFLRIISIIEIIGAIGIYLVNYFTRKKMGMARYVIYKSQMWEKEFPIDLIKYGVIVLIIVLTMVLSYYFYKNKNNMTKYILVNVLIMIFISVLSVLYIVLNSTESYRAYYFTSMIFALISIIQIIKVGLTFKFCASNKILSKN
ncbi:MAG: hypothetical protein ACK5LY_06575 [Lachnospirales bacterium]